MTESMESDECIVLNTISPLRKTVVEAVGRAFLHLATHTELETPFAFNPLSAEDSESSDDEDATEHRYEDDLEYLRSLDPKEWKDQDHYAVLGLSGLRHKATEDDIKRAYKRKILKHHPDKRKAMGEEVRRDDDYFTCITRAWEMLGNPVKRRSYDSVDSHFSDDLPEEKEAKKKFYEVMGKAFEENSRWSERKPVPQLGGPDTPRDKIERFYSFWYEFESWREYSYLDEEDKESGQDRDMRKWIERKNKAARAKRKREEMARIRTLVDMAYNLDPRVRNFQREDRDRKTAAKRAKQEAAMARQREEERLAWEAAERERQEREKRESEEKARTDALRQEREVQKKALRKERKALRELCKSNDYYTEDPAESVRHMESVEKVCELFKLAQLVEAMDKLRADGRVAFLGIAAEVEQRIEAERRAAATAATAATAAAVPCADARGTPERQGNKSCDAVPWTENELQLLIKAVNLFPAGTNQRWEVVARFIDQHGGVPRDPKVVLAKAKDLQSTDFSRSSLKERANRKAFDNFVAERKSKETIEERMPSAATERLDHPAAVANGEPTPTRTEPVPWTPVEQRLLEQALKTYPTVAPDRWDCIASCIPTRTKKECMRRYKDLVELVRARKTTTTTTTTTTK